MIKIYNSGNIIETNQIVQTLEESGIPVIKKDIGAGGYLTVATNLSFSGSDIYVNEEDQEKALEIINCITGDSDDEVLDEDGEATIDNSSYYANLRKVFRVVAIIAICVIVFTLVFEMLNSMGVL